MVVRLVVGVAVVEVRVVAPDQDEVAVAGPGSPDCLAGLLAGVAEVVDVLVDILVLLVPVLVVDVAVGAQVVHLRMVVLALRVVALVNGVVVGLGLVDLRVAPCVWLSSFVNIGPAVDPCIPVFVDLVG